MAKNKAYLILSGLLLVFLSTITTACPPKCSCGLINGGYQTLCQGLQLEKIPEGIPNITTQLILDWNRIRLLPEQAFPNQLPILSVIILRSNELAFINPNVFAYLSNGKPISAVPNLTHLNLENNSFTSIPEINCDLSPKLKGLDISNNRLEKFSFPSSFSKCKDFLSVMGQYNNFASGLLKNDFSSLTNTSFQSLTLGNNLSSIDDLAIIPIKMKIQSLTLTNNPLSYDAISNLSKSLMGSTTLTRLDLSRLTTPGVEKTRPPIQDLVLPNLETLDISDNVNWSLSVPFIGMPSLIRFGASRIRNLEISDNFFQSFPKLNYLFLSGTRITKVPPLLPESLITLDLTVCKFGDLTAVSFSLPNLSNLLLSYSDITRLNPLNFNLPKLQLLDLSNNYLSQDSLFSTASLFSEMPELRELYLSNNNIQSLQNPDIFKRVTKLNILFLNNQVPDKDGLSNLHQDIFSPLISLQTLSLADNPNLGIALATDLSGRIFSNQASLKTLYLSNVIMKTVPNSLFNGAQSVETLTLSGNQLTWQALDNITNSLNFQKISYIGLRSNYLTRISKRTLDAWSKSSSLSTIDLSLNPYQCDSDIVDFHLWLRTVTNNFMDSDSRSTDERANVAEKIKIRVYGYQTYVCDGPALCTAKRLVDFNGRPESCFGTSGTVEPEGLPIWAIVLIVVAIIVVIIAIIGVTLIGFKVCKRKNTVDNM